MGQLVVLGTLLTTAAVVADWWIGLPRDLVPQYVGRQTCAECHQPQNDAWHGSYHDLAMDRATEATVLGDFDNATLEHHGITSRMYRRDGKFWVHTEGPGGKLGEFEVAYVFGVDPLQQYLVEFDRRPHMPDHEIARLQVLRIAWDTHNKRWFHLDPPDVQGKLAPDDPLHWTGYAQNWNHMCADCHSTNVQKNFNVTTLTYHTTFSEIDVSCEACHGPGSIHVRLAQAISPFWDRHWKYGLVQLKGKDSRAQIETCAACHSRRQVVYPQVHLHDSYYDRYTNELLRPDTYYPDGQVRDEVYVYGSYLQSKMFQKGIRCTDCHDPHTTRVYYPDNQLCTSCHQHPAGKYDAQAHHHHQPGSEGSLCINCHMPATPFMEIDLRRDHSMKVPRPDLSRQLGVPNACTGCHVRDQPLSAEKRAGLTYYADWLAAARDGDEEVAAALAEADRWAQDHVHQWYSSMRQETEFAKTFAAAWKQDPAALPGLIDLARSRAGSGIIRASALAELARMPEDESVVQVAVRALSDPDPQVRNAAVEYLEGLPRKQLIQYIGPLLQDPVRLVRMSAARTTAGVPESALPKPFGSARSLALAEYRRGLAAHADQAAAHMALGLLAERMGDADGAAAAYRTAIRVQPSVVGPRSNLAALLEQQGHADQALELRREELPLLERDAQLAPDHTQVQYSLGLMLYLVGDLDRARRQLERACTLDPASVPYRLALTLLYERLELWNAARESARILVNLRPNDPTLRNIQQRLR